MQEVARTVLEFGVHGQQILRVGGFQFQRTVDDGLQFCAEFGDVDGVCHGCSLYSFVEHLENRCSNGFHLYRYQ